LVSVEESWIPAFAGMTRLLPDVASPAATSLDTAA